MEKVKNINFRVTEAEHKALKQYSLDMGKSLTTIFIENVLKPAEINWRVRKY